MSTFKPREVNPLTLSPGDVVRITWNAGKRTKVLHSVTFELWQRNHQFGRYSYEDSDGVSHLMMDRGGQRSPRGAKVVLVKPAALDTQLPLEGM